MASKKSFEYKLNDRVELKESGEQGNIIGRAHYVASDPQYLIRYKSAEGSLVESWWNEGAIHGLASKES